MLIVCIRHLQVRIILTLPAAGKPQTPEWGLNSPIMRISALIKIHILRLKAPIRGFGGRSKNNKTESNQ